MKSYIHLIPKLKNTFNYVFSKFQEYLNKDLILELNIKPLSSVKRKMTEKNISNPLELSDLVRGRLYFSPKYNFSDIKKLVKEIFPSSKVDIKNTKDYGLEYHGITHIDIRINGINFELQVIPFEFKPFKEFLHKIYEKLRTGNKNKKLVNLHNKIIKSLDDLAKSNRKNLT